MAFLRPAHGRRPFLERPSKIERNLRRVLRVPARHWPLVHDHRVESARSEPPGRPASPSAPGKRRFPSSSAAAAGLPLLLLFAGCPAPEQETGPVAAPAPRQAAVIVSPDPWVLRTEAPLPELPVYLSSGELGQRIGPLGGGMNGSQPLPAHRAGLYADEALVTLPPLLPLEIRAGSSLAEAAELKAYSQALDLRRARLTTRFEWRGAQFEIETLLPRGAGSAALLRGAVSGRGAPEISIAVAGAGEAAPGMPRIVHELTDLESPEKRRSNLPGRDGLRFALVSSVMPASPGRRSQDRLEKMVAVHEKEWEELWKRDIEIEGDPEAQQVVRSCLFYLLQSVRPGDSSGVPPMGLSSTAFQGHVFWDMDSWIFPALLPQHPEAARSMIAYRLATLDGARYNARRSGRKGAEYAWESGKTGRETIGKALFTHGEHVTGDVALAIRQYWEAEGDRCWLADAWPAIAATAAFWVSRVSPAPGGGYRVKGVTTPDENAGLVDDSAWTHHVARLNLELAIEAAAVLGKPVDSAWRKVVDGLSLPRDPGSGLIRAHSAFSAESKAKQADALLLFHPGRLRLKPAETLKMYRFYQPRVIANGPAMTEAIHSIVAARTGQPEEALERFRASYRPFLRGPFHLFSEKRSRDNLCFLTGAAGVVEAVLYGFGGLKLDAPAPSQPRFPSNRGLLPPGWTRLKIRGIQWRGSSSDLEIAPGQPPRWAPSG